jgi:hypothetical protein
MANKSLRVKRQIIARRELRVFINNALHSHKKSPLPNGLAKYDRITKADCFVRERNKIVPMFSRIVYQKVKIPDTDIVIFNKQGVVCPDIIANSVNNPHDFYGVR